jgi:hypothetical protein
LLLYQMHGLKHSSYSLFCFFCFFFPLLEFMPTVFGLLLLITFSLVFFFLSSCFIL